MISMMVADIFDKIAHRWNTDRGLVVVEEDDVTKVLDHAAKRLYDGEVGDRIHVGGLIIEKRESGHDVYVYVGNYQ